MERVARPVEDKPLFETKDYAVEVTEIEVKDLPSPVLKRKYAIYHKTHKVVAGLAEQFGGAIEAARNLQEAQDRAIEGLGPDLPGERSLPRPPRGFGSGNPGGVPPQLS